MENQPPIRPWYRLASLARMDAAQGQTPAPVSAPPPRPPTQAPVPRIPPARALTMSTQALPLQPPPTLQQEMPPPPPPPPPPQQQQETPSRSMGDEEAPVSQQPSRLQASPPPPSPRRVRTPPRDPTPPESPRVIKSSSSTPAESPRNRTFLPFQAQPSPNPEPEQKSVMESQPKSILTRQESSNSSVKAIKKESSGKWNQPAANGTSATSRRKEEGGGWKIITIAGENMGAYMEVGSSHHHQKEKHQNGQQQQNHQGLGEDGRSADKKGGKPIAAVVNNNVQSVNNSLLFSSKCKQNSPGVHLALASHRQPKLSKGSSAANPSFAKRNSHLQ